MVAIAAPSEIVAIEIKFNCFKNFIKSCQWLSIFLFFNVLIDQNSFYICNLSNICGEPMLNIEQIKIKVISIKTKTKKKNHYSFSNAWMCFCYLFRFFFLFYFYLFCHMIFNHPSSAVVSLFCCLWFMGSCYLWHVFFSSSMLIDSNVWRFVLFYFCCLNKNLFNHLWWLDHFRQPNRIISNQQN